MGYLTTDKKKITAKTFIEMKQAGEKITQLTAYDYTTAGIIDAAGIDSILVGDSASNVMAGNMTTLPITLDQMIYHAKAVVRATKRALVVCDMPFGTYQVHPTESVTNAIRIMKESHCDALKLEGGVEIIDTVRKILDAGIPICGHLGLTPQSINKFGTYTVDDVLREIRKRENEDPEEEYTKQNLYEDEYQVFCLRDYEQPDDYQFRIESTDVSDTLSDYIEDVIMVKRLREVLALKGFRRISPEKPENGNERFTGYHRHLRDG